MRRLVRMQPIHSVAALHDYDVVGSNQPLQKHRRPRGPSVEIPARNFHYLGTGAISLDPSKNAELLRLIAQVVVGGNAKIPNPWTLGTLQAIEHLQQRFVVFVRQRVAESKPNRTHDLPIDHHGEGGQAGYRLKLHLEFVVHRLSFIDGFPTLTNPILPTRSKNRPHKG